MTRTTRKRLPPPDLSTRVALAGDSGWNQPPLRLPAQYIRSYAHVRRALGPPEPSRRTMKPLSQMERVPWGYHPSMPSRSRFSEVDRTGGDDSRVLSCAGRTPLLHHALSHHDRGTRHLLSWHSRSSTAQSGIRSVDSKEADDMACIAWAMPRRVVAAWGQCGDRPSPPGGTHAAGRIEPGEATTSMPGVSPQLR